jgi:hypothetical protein
MHSPESIRATAVSNLVETIVAYLETNGGPGTAEVLAALELIPDRSLRPTDPQPVPLCGFLDEALDMIDGRADLRQAIGAARPFLHWVTYDLYPREEIGPYFPVAHAFASLVGPDAPIHAADFELGLFLIAPRILYRDRHHAAPELYAPLTGPHRWRFGVNEPWIELPAHRMVWNESWAVHATATGESPFLSIYSWTSDINVLARVVRASDWNMIEAAL